MYRFNNDNIITGYIKQLLHSFNLPKCKVFKNVKDFTNYYPTGSSAFGIVKNYKNGQDCILYKNKGDIELRSYYLYDKPYQNITTNLSLFNGLYDSTCHKYLGEYLRFIRDYENINLMSMYNCFANEILISNKAKYLIIPVKHNTTYTIAFEGKKYEYVFTYRSGLENIENLFDIPEERSEDEKVYSTTSYFLKPFKVTSSIGKDELITIGPRAGQYKYACFKEQDYKLVIKLGLTDNDVITVLEGDYTTINQNFTPVQANFDKEIEDPNYNNVNLEKHLSDLQLLDYHLGQKNVNYPFADRLVEYLTDMTILPNDKISNNIIEAKYKVYERYGNNGNLKHTRNKLGVLNSSFTNIDRLRFLDAFSQTKYEYKNSYDLLGYVDKEIEQCLDDETRNPKETD